MNTERSLSPSPARASAGHPTVAATHVFRRPGRPLDDLKRWIVVFAIGALALLSIFRAVDLWWWRNDLLARGASQADNLSQIVAEYLTGAFAATDAALRQLQDHGRRVTPTDESTDEWRSILGSTKATLTGAGSISITDASGVIVQSTQPVIVGQSRRSLFLFQRLATGPADELVIDPPFLTVSEPHHFVLPLARRLARPDDSFNGIVVVVFEPSQLRSFFRSVDVGRRGQISVLHPNGAVLYREPSNADAMGQAATADPILAAARERPNGTLRHVLASTGVQAITAFHTTGAPPLIVSVSLSQGELLDEWQREVIGSFGAFALLSLIVGGGAVVAFRQIDGRMAAERALQDLEQRTRFALEAARVGIWELDLTSGDLNWSSTMEGLHGLAPGQFGRTVRAFIELIHPEDRQEVERTLAQAALARTDSNILYRTMWSDGTCHRMTGVGRTFFDAAGNPVRSAGVSMDVTERYRMEERFRQSQKLESIGQLAAGVAHDFNNLLTAILGHCELLEETFQTGATIAQHSVAEIRRASERAASLTQQLLAFGRRQMLAPRVLNLGTSLTIIQPMLRRLIREDIEISVLVAPNLAHVHIDPGQVEQVILNLALNARDAMPEGGTLTLELENVVLDESDGRQHAGMRPGRFAVLAVSDSGTGMDATTRAHIFEPFFTTKEQGKGTGLGLATVYGIVEQSGGHIGVYSEPGHGSTFRVYLPAVDAPVDEPPPSAIVSTSRGSETILVVEDESGVRALIQRVLTGRGYQVLLASTPSEALAIEQSHDECIDLVISDVVLPEMPGPMLVEQLIVNRPERPRAVHVGVHGTCDRSKRALWRDHSVSGEAVYGGSTPAENSQTVGGGILEQRLIRLFILAVEVERAMAPLNDREREVLRLRYGFGIDRVLTLEEIGRRLSVTREGVRQIEMKGDGQAARGGAVMRRETSGISLLPLLRRQRRAPPSIGGAERCAGCTWAGHGAPLMSTFTPYLHSLSYFRTSRWLPSVQAAKVLWRDYAHLNSVRTRQAVDRAGNPLPWYTYPAIEFLQQLDFSQKTVFEYGSGMSTLFWAARTARVVSVEDDEQWMEKVRSMAPSNVDLIFEPDLSKFANTIRLRGERYDVIVVDGPARGRTRLKCSRAAVDHLQEGGLIILDNSDWLPESSKLLRDSALLEVDMTGFAPICAHVQTTSLYFDRRFNVGPLRNRQPLPGIGARLSNWEQRLEPTAGPQVECGGEVFRGVRHNRTKRFDTPDGPLELRIISYLGADDIRSVAVLDVARDRVLVTQRELHPSAEIERLAALTFEPFRAFVNQHPMRRCLV